MENSFGDILMESIELKKEFDFLAKANGFEKDFEGWFKISNETILVIELQKSNFGNMYYVNIKLFIQGVFGNIYKKCKRLVKIDVGNIFFRVPDKYSCFLDLEAPLDDQERKLGLKEMFNNFIAPFSDKASTREGIKALYNEGEIFILPAVKEELGI